MLLVDSEEPVTVEDMRVWDHVKSRQGDGWDKPESADAVLKKATSNLKTKRPYGKGEHSFSPFSHRPLQPMNG